MDQWTSTYSESGGAITWGASAVDSPEQSEAWSTWQYEDLETVDTSAGDYGHMAVYTTSISPVKNINSPNNITLTKNKYDIGIGDFTLYIRGQGSSFAASATSPDWQEYTGPFDSNWSYVQAKVEVNV